MTASENNTQELQYEIVRLRPEHKFSSLSLGEAEFTPLKTFAKNDARKFEYENLARTYVALIDDKPKAYITILCGEVSTNSDNDSLIEDEIGYKYKQYPAVKIARLAVDKSLQGKGIGRHLVDLALDTSLLHICPYIGCRFIMVDAKKKSVKFYENYGFTVLNTEENKKRNAPIMYMDLKKIQDEQDASTN